MKAQLSRVHWSRVLGTGVLVFILVTLLDAILSFLIFLVWGQLDHGQIASQVAIWSTNFLAFLLTVAGGVWIARKIEREPPLHSSAPLHGLLVGLFVALASLLLSLVFSGSFGSFVVVLVDVALFVVAGWLGGVLGSRVWKKT
jgi:putative membrane protein (TIGR04086 family)